MMNDMPEIALIGTRIYSLAIPGGSRGEGGGVLALRLNLGSDFKRSYVSKTLGYAKIAKSTTLYRLELVSEL